MSSSSYALYVAAAATLFGSALLAAAAAFRHYLGRGAGARRLNVARDRHG